MLSFGNKFVNIMKYIYTLKNKSIGLKETSDLEVMLL